MSRSETGMILAVVPQKDGTSEEMLYERSGAETHCCVKRREETIQIQFSGRKAGPYVMIAGVNWINSEIIVNGRRLREVASREGLYFTEGYLQKEDGVLLKINPSAEFVITMQKKK